MLWSLAYCNDNINIQLFENSVGFFLSPVHQVRHFADMTMELRRITIRSWLQRDVTTWLRDRKWGKVLHWLLLSLSKSSASMMSRTLLCVSPPDFAACVRALDLFPVWNTTQMMDGFLFELEVGHTNSFAVFSLQMFFLSWLQMSFLFSIFLFWSPFSHFVFSFHFLYREQWRYLLPRWMDATQFCCSLWMMSCYLHGGLKSTCPVWY